ncbi:MAG: hypothetical protein UT33_C0007G0015 [Candidatus Peregrinibacteria bacterium GW2011_GWC2_39_14]|nr:MAG: hypothetical protein US92_C0002G0016 [Candidatus Peregrinibacteria bacterium GW2011_GWA2_38_36]KKR06827.1 MAG: hypothetical protein UT33_C0007G0015 [Candidatus Peregrinibacteria bacterium GW2011_GWC2_39_14]
MSQEVRDYLNSDELDFAYFSEWARDAEQKRNERLESLVNSEQFSDLWMKRELLSSGAARHFLKKDFKTGEMVENDNTKGAHNDVYEFDRSKFKALLQRWVGLKSPRVAGPMDVAIDKFADYISGRFVMKVGRTKHFIVKFGVERRYVPRDMMAAAFDPVGYPQINGPTRIAKLNREVLRAGAFIGSEENHPIVAPCVLSEIEKFLGNPLGFEPAASGEFMLRDDSTKPGKVSSGKTISDVAEIDSNTPKFSDRAAYIAFNKEARKCGIDKLERDLRPFFDSLVRLGFHDIVQRFAGTKFGKKLLGDKRANVGYKRHTTLTYEEAEKIIKKLTVKYKDHSFLAAEQTTYGYDPRVSAEEWGEIAEGNEKAVSCFEHDFTRVMRDMPDYIRTIFDDPKIAHEFCYMAIEHWHQSPDYAVDQTDTVMSLTMVKLLLKAAYYFYVLDSKTPYTPQRSTKFSDEEGLKRFFEKFKDEDLLEMSKRMNLMLRLHDQCAKQEKRPKFQRFEKTSTKMQDRLDYNGGDRKIFGPMPISELMTKNQKLLKDYKGISEQLLVYFYQLYKMFKQTGYILDQRPDNVAEGVFIFGDWALQAENIQIVIFEDANGHAYPKIVNIDPEDHFRLLPKDLSKKDPREGLGTSGLSVADLIAEASAHRSIGFAIDNVADNMGIPGDKTDWSPERLLVQAALDVTRTGVSSIRTSVDDASHAARGEFRNRIGEVLSFLGVILQTPRQKI